MEVDWTFQPSSSQASFKPCEPPNLPNLAGSRGGSGELGVHSNGTAKHYIPTIIALFQVFLFSFFFFFLSSLSSFFLLFFFCCHQQYYPKQITTTWSFFPTPLNKDMMTMARTCLTTRGVLIDPPGGWVPSTRQPITFWQWHRWWFRLSPLLLYLQASTKRKRHGKGEKGERKK